MSKTRLPQRFGSETGEVTGMEEVVVAIVVETARCTVVPTIIEFKTGLKHLLFRGNLSFNQNP
jgi:hypothetical protein